MAEVGPNEFRCENCGGVFEKGWTDAESVAEAEQVWGAVPDDPALICDPCYQRFLVWAKANGLTVD